MGRHAPPSGSTRRTTVFRRRRSAKSGENEDDFSETTDEASLAGRREDSDTEGEFGGTGDDAATAVADDAEIADDLRANGPWDVDEIPAVVPAADRNEADDDDDDADRDDNDDADLDLDEDVAAARIEQPSAEEAPRLDLGAVRVRPLEGMQLQLELDEATRQVRGVTIVDGDSALQISAFAAPRSSGLWDDMRRELAADATRRGGTATEMTGSFGRELKVALPARTKDGRMGTQASRIIGVDGPRWMLRGNFFGRAAMSAKGDRLEQVFRSVVVVRGALPMAPGDQLPLTMPPGAAAPPVATQPGRTESAMGPLVRGPEITETR